MITDEAIKELAEILVGTVGNINPVYKKLAKEHLEKQMLENKESIVVSLEKYHAWMHRNNVGVFNESKDNGCNDDIRSAWNRKIDSVENDSEKGKSNNNL